ncbi:hypothetical protein DPMN_031113 [Dreissena polymorpha]|uniref:ABC transmembrane type-1 domain-containing protein n=1 Tax=Dreissena polymorpha TaxID=45954 RepID=A0A9D4RIQ9_DREPO|nr:hypothetical protein DPMN_031113 [Dreissena polymorpha]
MSEFLNAALYELCGSELFWNDSNLERVTPELTSCFLNTLPVWIPCGFLWMVAIPYIVYLVKNRRPSLPFTCLSVSKMALAFALLCLADLHFTFQQMYGNHCAGLEVVQLSVQVAVGVRLATYMLVIIILHVQRKFGCKTSGVTYTFWILQICGETFSIYAYSLDKTQCQTHVVFYMYYAVIWLQFLIHSFAEKGPTTGRHGKEPCPLDNGSILNRLTYCWMGKTIHSIYKKTFQRDQMWAQSEILKASIIGPALEKAWKKEQSKLRQRKTTIKRFSVKLTDVEETIEQTSFTATMSDSSEKTPLLKRVGDVRDEVKRSEKRPSANLLKVLMKTYAFDITEFVVYSFLSLLTYFLQPLILRYLLDFIDKKNSPGSDPAPKTWEGVVYCICMVVIIQVCAVFYNTVLFHTATLGLRIKHSLMYLIYKKALTVSKSENNISVGEVVNHMSIDCVRLQDAVFFSYYVPNAILFAIISAYMLYESVGGPATAAGMAFSLLYIPVNSYIVRIQNKLQNELLHLKGLRVRLMNEILCGVKVLKMYAWEYTFIKKVDEVRVREIRLLKKNAYLMAIGTSLANHSQFLIHFTIILVYVLLKDGHYISSSTAFVSLSIIAILKYPLTVLPYLLNTLVQAYVSTKRIQDFLSCSDLDEIESIFVKSADYAIYVRDGVFTWDTSDRKPDLPNINLKIPQRQLIAVVGNCGAGKSSLVSALLGEMRKLDGVLEIKVRELWGGQVLSSVGTARGNEEAGRSP